MFLIKPGREGHFGQRDKLRREAVWDAGNKKASEKAFCPRPPASLRRHNHKTPASATTRPGPARLARRLHRSRQAATAASRAPRRLRPGPEPEPDHPPPPHRQGRKAPAEIEEEGETGMIPHLCKVSRTTPRRRWWHVNSQPSVAQRHVLPHTRGASDFQALSQAWASASRAASSFAPPSLSSNSEPQRPGASHNVGFYLTSTIGRALC